MVGEVNILLKLISITFLRTGMEFMSTIQEIRNSDTANKYISLSSLLGIYKKNLTIVSPEMTY